MPKITFRMIPAMLVLLFGAVSFASAQGLSAYFGVGTATDSANRQPLDTIGDVGPSMGGPFLVFGADYMFRPRLGFGAEYSFRADQGTYAPQAGVNYRPAFYDFNAIWHPISSPTARIVPEFQAGVGGANTRFYETATECAISNVCQTLNEYISSSNHFQFHVAGGVRIYVTPSIYIRPQIDAHWVNNFREFGSSWAPEYSATVGYTFGRQSE